MVAGFSSHQKCPANEAVPALASARIFHKKYLVQTPFVFVSISSMQLSIDGNARDLDTPSFIDKD